MTHRNGQLCLILTVGSVLAAFTFGAGSQAGTDECPPQWIPTFGHFPGFDGTVRAFTIFDDGKGAGPALYVAGSILSIGDVQINGIAKWDGYEWSAFASGLNGTVNSMVVYDDGLGDGPVFYVGGSITSAGGIPVKNIARWDSTQWSSPGAGIVGAVEALAVFDDGSGPKLYVCGNVITAGNINANRIARWNGTSWSAVGSGLGGHGHAMTVHDDGTGPALYVGGAFSTAGGVAAKRIARWNGSEWSAVGDGFDGWVYGLLSYDDPSGGEPVLVASGHFAMSEDVIVNNIARWNGEDWSALGEGVSATTSYPIRAMTVHDDGSGSGPALYAGAGNVSRWNGLTWTSVGQGASALRALVSFKYGSEPGPSLYAGGTITSMGGIPIAGGIVRWDGIRWHGIKNGLHDGVRALTVFDDGSGEGPALYAGGEFRAIGELFVSNVARWNGHWSRVGSTNDAWALTVFDDGLGGGPALYKGGFLRVSRWTGTTWQTLGGWKLNNIYGHIYSLASFDDGLGGGPALYAAGIFTEAGGLDALNIAKWNPRTQTWSALQEGLNDWVVSLTVFDDGRGPALYAGGTFTMAGETPVKNIARWDGRTWSSVGDGTNGPVYALTVFDDQKGQGPALVVGGKFSSAGTSPATNIAQWNGETWSPLGVGLNDWVWTLNVTNLDNGCASVLDAGGGFTFAGDVGAHHVARWNGRSWSGLGSAIDGPVYALADFDDGTGCGTALFVGGYFENSYAGDSYLAKFQGCSGIAPLPGDITGEGLVDVNDVLALINAWGPCTETCPPSCPADIAPPGGDCSVGVPDLLMVINNWG